LTTSPFPGYNSLDELYQRAVDLYEDADCLGTRELLSEEDELQPSGKVFRKASIHSLHCSRPPSHPEIPGIESCLQKIPKILQNKEKNIHPVEIMTDMTFLCPS